MAPPNSGFSGCSASRYRQIATLSVSTVPSSSCNAGVWPRGLTAKYSGAFCSRATIETALGELEARGAQRVPVSLPSTALAIPCYYVLATAEAASNLARFDGVRSVVFDRANTPAIANNWIRALLEDPAGGVSGRDLPGVRPVLREQRVPHQRELRISELFGFRHGA